MKDAGFDISNYHMIRPALVSNASNWYQIFEQFVQEAHKRGIAVLMVIFYLIFYYFQRTLP